MGKLTIPSSDFDKELASASVSTTMKAAGASPVMNGLYQVPHSQLRRIDGFNVRVDTPDYLAHIATLKASIKSEGFFPNKPLAGYVAKEEDGNVIYITDGYSRERAVAELIEEGVDGFDDEFKIPVIVKPTSSNLEDLTVALVLDNEGRPLSVYERAIVVKRLTNMGVEDARIAERLDCTTRYVSDLQILAGASSKVRNMVIKGQVSPTEAIKQLRKSGAGAAAKLEEGVKAAQEAGKAKATAKNIEPKAKAEPEEGVNAKLSTRDGKVKQTITYAYKQGAIVPYDDIKPVRLFNDADWWNFVDEETKEDVVIEETITIEVTITTNDSGDEDDKSGDTQDDDDTFADGDTPALEDQSDDGDEGSDDTTTEDDDL